jgi:hypothetical protein
MATGCLCPEKESGRPGVSEEDAELVRETFTRSPKKSVTLGSYIESLSGKNKLSEFLFNDTYMISV